MADLLETFDVNSGFVTKKKGTGRNMVRDHVLSISKEFSCVSEEENQIPTLLSVNVFAKHECRRHELKRNRRERT